MPVVPKLNGRPIVQHGSFLPFLPTVPDDEVLLFVDVDAVFQRPFEPREYRLLDSLKEDEWLVGMNRMDPEYWRDEAPRLCPTHRYGTEYKGEFDGVPVFNTGFMAMRRSTYKRVYDEFMILHRRHHHWFQHHAATQLFICAAAYSLGLTRVRPSLGLTSHGHCGIHPGVSILDNRAYEQGILLCYAHMLCGL
jgi:hypothetical protein